jgi:prolipoprotein diacylglyceryltransferase
LAEKLSWAGVEIVKKIVGLRERTGDLFVLPLALGMGIGRIGCFLTGLSDHTYGIATSLPWGVDFGDGVRRHPTQLYEMVFLFVWGGILWMVWNRFGPVATPRADNANPSRCDGAERRMRRGDLFRIFMVGYLAMRLAIEFIKPTWKPYLGLSAIQLACIGGIIVAAWQLWKARTDRAKEYPRTSNGVTHA